MATGRWVSLTLAASVLAGWTAWAAPLVDSDRRELLDAHALAAPASATGSVKALAAYLVAPSAGEG